MADEISLSPIQGKKLYTQTGIQKYLDRWIGWIADSYLDGQHTGVVTKAFSNTIPSCTKSFCTLSCTAREPSLTSWSSVRMYTDEYTKGH